MIIRKYLAKKTNININFIHIIKNTSQYLIIKIYLTTTINLLYHYKILIHDKIYLFNKIK